MMNWLCSIYLLAAPIQHQEAELLALQRIADFWTDGETSIAKAQMIDFLSKYPTSLKKDMLAEALGDLSLQEGDFGAALDWYAKIQSLDTETFLKKLRCLYQMGWYATLIDEASSYKNEPKNLEITRFLALSLYQQCLNDTSRQEELAQRAKPLFGELLAVDQNEEIAHALAHIHTMLDDLEGASLVYEKMAEINPDKGFLLQAAILEAKFAPEKAIARFEKILDQQATGMTDAAYWWIALQAKAHHHEEVIQKFESLLPLIEDAKKGSAFIFAATSYRSLGQNDKAAEMFRKGIELGQDGEYRRAAMIALAESCYLSDNLPELESITHKLKAENPADPTLPFWEISRAKMLEKVGRLEEALIALSAIDSSLAKTQAIQLQIKMKQAANARKSALALIEHAKEPETKQLAYRLLLQASHEISDEKTVFLQDLKAAVENGSPSPEEAKSWTVMIGAVAYELQDTAEALQWALPIASKECPDAELIVALCKKETSEFIPLAEKALADGATLLSPPLQHILLFNAYRESNEPMAAAHLYAALSESIQEENLLWLLQYAEKNFPAEKREAIAERLCAGKELSPGLEKPFLELAKAKEDLGKIDDAAALYEKLIHGNEHIAETAWRYATLLKKVGNTEKANQLLEEASSSSCSKKDRFVATATLDFARTKQDPQEAASILRDLILQKNLANEPIHLEAALDTIELLGNTPEKAHSLFQKMKKEFTEEETLLSKDYHAARKADEKQNALFAAYMELMDAGISAFSSDLQEAEAGKNRLVQLKDHPTLSSRATSFLNRSGTDAPIEQ